jgi:hypothetical protein
MKRKKERLSIDSSWSLPEKVSHLSQEGKTYLRSKAELGLATKYFHTHAHLDLRV